MKDISIIIPNLNSTMIGQTIASLKAQTGFTSDDIEVLVVGLDELGQVQEDGTVRFIDTGWPVCAAAARNLGMKEARGRYLVFVDADCLAPPGWLMTIRDCHESGEHVVCGSVIFPHDNYWTLCDNVSMFHEFLPNTKASYRPYVPTLNLSVSREVVQAVGGFDESFPGASAEDIDWTIRIRRQGYRLYFEPAAQIVHHPPRASPAQVLGHWLRAGRNMVRVRLRYPDEFNTPWFVRHAWWLIVLSPLIALWATVRIFAVDRAPWRYLPTLPVLYLTKIAWCVGAAQQVRQSEQTGATAGKLQA